MEWLFAAPSKRIKPVEPPQPKMTIGRLRDGLNDPARNASPRFHTVCPDSVTGSVGFNAKGEGHHARSVLATKARNDRARASRTRAGRRIPL
jgi:hypothetical protein